MRQCPKNDRDFATTRDTQNDRFPTFLVFETFPIWVFQVRNVNSTLSSLTSDHFLNQPYFFLIWPSVTSGLKQLGFWGPSKTQDCRTDEKMVQNTPKNKRTSFNFGISMKSVYNSFLCKTCTFLNDRRLNVTSVSSIVSLQFLKTNEVKV